MAEVAVNALRDFASGRYSIDNTNEMLSDGSGTSTDFALHKAGIKYSYTIELRDTGTQGFLLSPSYIDTTGIETFEMVKAMVDFLWMIFIILFILIFIHWTDIQSLSFKKFLNK